jgi:hypothetical protein
MIRIQRRRTRGWRMPDGAVYVGRPSRWGNPYRVGQPLTESEQRSWWPPLPPTADARAAALLYASLLPRLMQLHPDLLEPLRGRVLACWCPVGPGTWCHADAILAWFEANPLPVREGERPVFGLHRMDPADAAAAPAFRTVTEGVREAAYRRELRAWARREGAATPVPAETRP